MILNISVFGPDLFHGEDAASLIKELSLILQRLEVCSCKMELGAMRVDANISVRPLGSEILGVRTEVKNINSVRGIVNAIEHEIDRQIEVLENGGTVINETRNYDGNLKRSVPMRDKEVKQDYRYDRTVQCTKVKNLLTLQKNISSSHLFSKSVAFTKFLPIMHTHCMYM